MQALGRREKAGKAARGSERGISHRKKAQIEWVPPASPLSASRISGRGDCEPEIQVGVVRAVRAGGIG